jgi:hypothetical protein
MASRTRVLTWGWTASVAGLVSPSSSLVGALEATVGNRIFALSNDL